MIKLINISSGKIEEFKNKSSFFKHLKSLGKASSMRVDELINSTREEYKGYKLFIKEKNVIELEKEKEIFINFIIYKAFYLITLINNRIIKFRDLIPLDSSL